MTGSHLTKLDQGIQILQLQNDQKFLFYSSLFSEYFHLYLRKSAAESPPFQYTASHMSDWIEFFKAYSLISFRGHSQNFQKCEFIASICSSSVSSRFPQGNYPEIISLSNNINFLHEISSMTMNSTQCSAANGLYIICKCKTESNWDFENKLILLVPTDLCY